MSTKNDDSEPKFPGSRMKLLFNPLTLHEKWPPTSRPFRDPPPIQLQPLNAGALQEFQNVARNPLDILRSRFMAKPLDLSAFQQQTSGRHSDPSEVEAIPTPAEAYDDAEIDVGFLEPFYPTLQNIMITESPSDTSEDFEAEENDDSILKINEGESTDEVQVIKEIRPSNLPTPTPLLRAMLNLKCGVTTSHAECLRLLDQPKDRRDGSLIRTEPPLVEGMAPKNGVVLVKSRDLDVRKEMQIQSVSRLSSERQMGSFRREYLSIHTDKDIDALPNVDNNLVQTLEPLSTFQTLNQADRDTFDRLSLEVNRTHNLEPLTGLFPTSRDDPANSVAKVGPNLAIGETTTTHLPNGVGRSYSNYLRLTRSRISSSFNFGATHFWTTKTFKRSEEAPIWSAHNREKTLLNSKFQGIDSQAKIKDNSSVEPKALPEMGENPSVQPTTRPEIHVELRTTSAEGQAEYWPQRPSQNQTVAGRNPASSEGDPSEVQTEQGSERPGSNPSANVPAEEAGTTKVAKPIANRQVSGLRRKIHRMLGYDPFIRGTKFQKILHMPWLDTAGLASSTSSRIIEESHEARTPLVPLSEPRTPITQNARNETLVFKEQTRPFRFSEGDKAIMEARFQVSMKPSWEEMEILAQNLACTNTQVKSWFERRVKKLKKENMALYQSRKVGDSNGYTYGQP